MTIQFQNDTAAAHSALAHALQSAPDERAKAYIRKAMDALNAACAVPLTAQDRT